MCVVVPLTVVQVGDTLRLVCNYAVGGDQLYSIKWYKVRLATLSALQGLVQDNQEFYRFTPRDSPSAQQFGVEGVVVRLDRSAAWPPAPALVILPCTGLTTGQSRSATSHSRPRGPTCVRWGCQLNDNVTRCFWLLLLAVFRFICRH